MTLDAYDLYATLWKFIVVNRKQSQVEEALKTCQTDGEIIATVLRIVGENDSDPFKLVDLEGDSKNEVKAIACRKSGNSNFHPKVRRYIQAVEQYNESIALSEDHSENLAIVYANRSAVCFELMEYADCLENIRLARANLYPEHLLPKLEKRETDCLKFLESSKVSDGVDLREAKLSYKPHPKIPHVSDCIELKEDEKFGRYLISNRNLNAGDIIIEEKPFSTLLDAKLRYTHCNYCHEDKFLKLIPCKTCTITMFCSEDCRNKAWDSYHRLECSVIKDMYFLFTKVILMGLRTVTTTISTFNYILEELRLFIESIDEGSSNPFKLDWTAIDSKQVYGTIHVLATNQKLRDTSDLVQRSVYAIIMSDLLFRRTELGQLCDKYESHDLIRQLLFRHSQTSPVNMHSMMFMDYTPTQNETFSQAHLGCGSFPILSMINHSCAPNLVRITLPNGHIAAFLNRPVKKGGQLFDNYGYHHCLESLMERQSGLSNQYCFQCQCEACKQNYPLYFKLPRAKLPARVKQPIDYHEMSLIGEHDMATALRKIHDFCNFLNSFDSQYPNYELSSVQEALLRCYQIVFAKQSRKIKYRDLSSF